MNIRCRVLFFGFLTLFFDILQAAEPASTTPTSGMDAPPPPSIAKFSTKNLPQADVNFANSVQPISGILQELAADSHISGTTRMTSQRCIDVLNYLDKKNKNQMPVLGPEKIFPNPSNPRPLVAYESQAVNTATGALQTWSFKSRSSSGGNSQINSLLLVPLTGVATAVKKATS